MAERILLKAVVFFILRARAGAVSYYDKPWKKGTLLVGEENVYFHDGGSYFRIPISKITDLSRETVSGSGWKDTGYPVMSLRYYEGDQHVTALVSSRSEALDKIKRTIELQGVSESEAEVSDIEIRLLILIYTGITDWSTIAAVLDISRDQVAATVDKLRTKGILDSMNKLTPLGARIVRRSGKI